MTVTTMAPPIPTAMAAIGDSRAWMAAESLFAVVDPCVTERYSRDRFEVLVRYES